jgi:hypothetical protein
MAMPHGCFCIYVLLFTYNSGATTTDGWVVNSKLHYSPKQEITAQVPRTDIHCNRRLTTKAALKCTGDWACNRASAGFMYQPPIAIGGFFCPLINE